MIKLQTDNLLLLSEREKAKKYLLDEVLKESPFNSDMIDDLINLTEARLSNVEINEKNISMSYSKIYSPELKNALPPDVLKETTNLKIIR